MGYQTYFSGEVTIVPPLNAAEIAYLNAFNRARHVTRQGGDAYTTEPAEPGWSSEVSQEHPDGQPGYYCQWVPTEDGTALEWDEGEKAYDMLEWMGYLIDTFLKPGARVSELGDPRFAEFTFDHVCNGEVYADGEESEDNWVIAVVDNNVRGLIGVTTYPGLVASDSSDVSADNAATLLLAGFQAIERWEWTAVLDQFVGGPGLVITAPDGTKFSAIVELLADEA